MTLKIRKNLAPAPPTECPLAGCMSLLRGAWTPQILWFLSAAPRRFSELRVDMRGVSAKVLTTRLRDLETRGVLTRTVMSTSPPSVEYALTDLGQELVPVISTIVEVGHKLRVRRLQREALSA